MKSLVLVFLVFIGSCTHLNRPKGSVSYFVGTSTEYDAKTNQVIRDADILLETVVVNDMEEIHAWFYTGPGNELKSEIFPSVSKRTENSLVYIMTNPDGSYLGRHVFESEKKDKWRVELYFTNGQVNFVDYVMKDGEMELVQNVRRADGTPVMRIEGSLKLTDEVGFKQKKEAVFRAR